VSEKIEPALSAEEWAAYRRWSDAESALDVPPLHVVIEDFSAAGAISAYNDMLSVSDPRKITREKIVQLRSAAHYLEHSNGRLSTAWAPDDNPWHKLAADLRATADALQSYLPPEQS
jgi:hypothetical protein